MAGSTNKKRTKKRTGEEASLWGFLFDKNTQNPDLTKRAFFAQPGEEETDEPPAEPHNLFQEIWRRFNFWAVLATLIFLAFTILLISATISMWTPQNMRSIAGYADHGSARDLLALIRNANGQEISFTEAELNRYLRDTCRIRQTGVFSIITHGEGIAIKIHNGYAELIIDRLIGANIHQTTSVNLTFRQEIKHGRPELKVDFKGSEILYGKLAKGGSIGKMGIPERHIRMLAPALDTLLSCYPEICSIIETHGYCPYFTKGQDGAENRVTLIPYRPS